MSRWLELARTCEFETLPHAISADSAESPPIGTNGATGTGERNEAGSLSLPGGVWVSATCPRCGGVLLSLFLVGADGRRWVTCADCRRLLEVPRA